MAGSARISLIVETYSGYKAGHYLEARDAGAYVLRTAKGKPSVGAYYRYIFSNFVLGQDAEALRAARQAVKDHPESKPMHDWLVVSLFARQGFDAAWYEWQSYSDKGERSLADGLYQLEHDLATKSESSHANYAELFHLSRAYEALAIGHIWCGCNHDDEPYLRSWGTLSNDAEFIRDRDELLDKIVTIYQNVPMRPVLTDRLLHLQQQAEAEIANKNFKGAEADYDAILVEAPWWPDGHFNIALLLGPYRGFPRQDAIREMKFYLKLAPTGKYRDRANQKLATWGKDTPPHPGSY